MINPHLLQFYSGFVYAGHYEQLSKLIIETSDRKQYKPMKYYLVLF